MLYIVGYMHKGRVRRHFGKSGKGKGIIMETLFIGRKIGIGSHPSSVKVSNLNYSFNKKLKYIFLIYEMDEMSKWIMYG